MLFLVLLAITVGNISCANILFVTVVPSPSHHIWNEALVEGLLANGHNITLMGYEDTKIVSKNYTILKLEMGSFSDDELYKEMNVFQELLITWQMTVELSPQLLKSRALEIILDYPKDSFDLIVYDLTACQVLYPLIEYFGNPPVIGVSPFGIPPFIADAMGNNFYSYLPTYYLPYGDDMPFSERLENTLIYFSAYYVKWYYMPIIQKMAQDRFDGNILQFEQVEKQIALLLANYHPILDFPQPLPPQIIPVGGLNIKPGKKLPEELQLIMNNAKVGVIYFSLGTNISPSLWSHDKKQVFLETFARLKETVLWKYDGDDLKNIPKNVVIRKWYPQNDILGHDNVKLFITHNVALSMHEAIYHGKPLVGIPFFLDQINNAAKAEAKIIGKKVNFYTLTGDVLYEVIQELLRNPIYKNNVQKLSNQFRDRQKTPLETSIFWIEYILKHKDVKNLSTKGRYMALFIREHWDIIAFITLSIFLLGYVSVVAVKLIIIKYFSKRVNKIKQH